MNADKIVAKFIAPLAIVVAITATMIAFAPHIA